MNRRWITIPLLGLFVGINVYWTKYHLQLNVVTQMTIVLTSVFLYLLAGGLEVIYSKTKEQRRKMFHIFSMGLLGYYFFFVATAVFFDGYFFFRSGRENEVNSQLFYTIEAYFKTLKQGDFLRSLGNIVGNLILFTPLGVLLPLIHPQFKKWFFFTATILVLSISVEMLQYYLAIGSADIDDIFLNVCGALVVFTIMKIILYIFKDKIESYFK